MASISSNDPIVTAAERSRVAHSQLIRVVERYELSRQHPDPEDRSTQELLQDALNCRQNVIQMSRELLGAMADADVMHVVLADVLTAQKAVEAAVADFPRKNRLEREFDQLVG